MSKIPNIANQRQLFVDDLLIGKLENISLHQHAPIPRETSLTLDQPWEGDTSWCPVVIKEKNRYRMWYRSQGTQQTNNNYGHTFTAYAESEDGIHWTRPNLGLIDFNGSKNNNLCVQNDNTQNISVFIDPRPGIPDAERYKAAGRWRQGKPSRIYGLVSPDGIHWQNAQEEPLIIAQEPDWMFDSPISVFWDEQKDCYVLYARGWYPDGQEPKMRAIRMTTSKDFINWEPWQYITINDQTRYTYELYTNAGHPYYRAPYYLMFPKRFLSDRDALIPNWEYNGLSDVIFIASRDGHHFTQPANEAFLRPGLDLNNWHERSIYISPNIVPTAPGEMSLYTIQNYRTPTNHIQRFTLREDGFTSLHATGQTGTVTTKPFTFNGSHLEINFSTSAAGRIRIELQDETGTPIPNLTQDECPIIYGDHISHTVCWQNNPNLTEWANRPMRLKIEMQEADLYSFRFFSKD